MKAIVKTGFAPGITVKEVPDPKPGKDPIVRMERAAICGSDIHMFQDMSAYRQTVVPVVMGHEACGVIADPGGSRLKAGQKVVIDSVLSCGKCEYCRTGRENLCINRQTVGQQFDGVFTEFASLPERICIPVSDAISPAIGACVEPLGVALRGVEQAGLCPGDSVAIIGPGPIGLMSLLLCKLGGAARVDIIGTRMDEKRLALAAHSLGADHAYFSPEDLEGKSLRYDCVLEWSGAGPGLAAACRLAAAGGRIVAGAIYSKDVQLDMTGLVRREITLKTARSRTYRTWQRAIELVSSGKLDLSPIITHEFPIEEAQKAFELAAAKESIKTVFFF